MGWRPPTRSTVASRVCPNPAASSAHMAEASGPRQAWVSVITFSEVSSVPSGARPANPA